MSTSSARALFSCTLPPRPSAARWKEAEPKFSADSTTRSMNSAPGSWELRIKKPAQKNPQRAPRPERERPAAEPEAITRHPFGVDTQRLQGSPAGYRRRVGDSRILCDVFSPDHLIHVTNITRRTSTTYRQRH